MSKFYIYLGSSFFIMIGLLSMFGFETPSKIYGGVKPSMEHTMSSIIIGIILFYIGYKSKEKQEKYSKCPKCKEVFNYNELEKGKCKYCKDIETIELEEYYKKYPEELEEK